MINLKEKKTFLIRFSWKNKEQLSAVCAYLEKRETENIKIARIYAESNIFQEDIRIHRKIKKEKDRILSCSSACIQKRKRRTD